MRRFISSLLIFFGGMALGIWGWSLVRQSIGQKHDEEVFDRELAAPVRPQLPSSAGTGTVAAKATKAMHGRVVARLSIEKIQLRAMVREGADDDTLDVALGHIPGTALPGQKGNVGVAGHRDTLFRRLAEIGRNDQIQLQTPSATYTYKVDEMSIVTPEAVGVLAAGRGAELTLVTCYPFHYIGSAPKRYIVQAHLVSQASAESSALPAVGTRD